LASARRSKGLLGERVAGRGGERDARAARPVEPLRRRADVVARARSVEPGGREQVRAVDQQLAPAVAGHSRRPAVAVDELQRAPREGAHAERVDHGLRRVGVEDPLQRVGVREAERQAHHVGQLACRRGAGDEHGELVLVDGDELHLDAGPAGEGGRDLARGRDAVGPFSSDHTVIEPP
jgi:hypothetical protein